MLVCYEDRQKNENQKLLQEYKKKYMLNHIQLFIFSKDLKLTFHTNQRKHKYHRQSSSQESASYIL